MKSYATILLLLGALVVWPTGARAHCDAADGPVAAAARKALDTKNVNLILPYARAEAEPELTAAFEQALVVHGEGAEAKALADRYFMETAVRLHRTGEKAPYTGLQPAGRDFGPAIPAAERALESGKLDLLVTLLSQELSHGLAERLQHAIAKKAATKEPATKAGVQAARERVSAEFDFIGYAERLYVASKGGSHAE